MQISLSLQKNLGLISEPDLGVQRAEASAFQPRIEAYRASESVRKMTPFSLITENLIDPTCPFSFCPARKGRWRAAWSRAVRRNPGVVVSVAPAARQCLRDWQVTKTKALSQQAV